MIYLIDKSNFGKIDKTNIKSVITFVFKDYVDIINTYHEYVDATINNDILLNWIIDEIKMILFAYLEEPEKTLKYEKQIITELRERFAVIYKEVDNSVLKIEISKLEEIDKNNINDSDLNNLFF